MDIVITILEVAAWTLALGVFWGGVMWAVNNLHLECTRPHCDNADDWYEWRDYHHYYPPNHPMHKPSMANSATKKED